VSPIKTQKSARTRNHRTREYLTPEEIDRLLDVAKNGVKQPNGGPPKPATRNQERDFCLLGMMYRHGLRVTEAVDLRLDDIDLDHTTFHVRRLKDSASGAHPIYPADRKALSAWLKVRKAMKPNNDFLFISERRSQLNRTSVWEIIRVVATAAGLAHLNVHPHTLRHSTGFTLINSGVDIRRVQCFLGHRSIQTTTRYTALAANGFTDFFPK
jgi:site-specific recombinase XerD